MTVRAETEVTLTRVNDGDNGVKVYDGTAGSVVTVSNASEYPALELVADIIPIQPNDYSSVWVGGAGKNVCVPLEGTKNGIVRTLNDDGTVAITGKSTANSWSYLEEYYDLPYCGIDVGDTISIYSDVYLVVMAYNGSTSLGSKQSKGGTAATYTIPASTTRLRILQYPKSVQPVIDETFNTTAKYWVSKSAYSSWEPYENICPIYGHDHCNVVVSPTLLDTDGTTYTTNFPQVVYGGTLDVVNGILTVTYDNIASYNGETLNGEWISDRDVYVSGTTPTTGAQVVYELDTPIVYKVSPMDIELITGTCNIWATTGDITDFRYAEISPATLETFGEARKIAVKYVTDMGDDGIIVHPENDTSNYAKINAEGMDIVKNDESTAFYGDYARVGSENSSRIMIYPTDISMLNQDGAETFRVKTLDKTRSRKVYRNIGYWVNKLSTGSLDIADIMAEISSGTYFFLYVTANGSPEATELQFQKGTTATKTASYGGGSVSITYNGTTDIFAVDNTSSSDISTILAIAWVKSATWSRVEVDQIPLDYVVDQGHNTDGWDYVLFASGRAEAWLTVTWTGTLSTSNGGWYSTNESDGIATANMPSEIFVTANNSQPIYRDVTAYQDMYGLSSAKANVTPVLYNVENSYSSRYFGDVQLMRGNSYSTSRTYVINCHVMIPAKSNWQDYI
jgi:hypothetical protein